MRNYILNDTCAIFKTNPRLTGNVKIVVENSKSFYLTQLDFERNYVKYSLQNDFAQNVSSFLRNYVKDKYAIHNYDLSSNNNLKTDYLEQYDLMYQYGAKYSKYSNKLRFFAPLMFTKRNIPKFFVIAAKLKKQQSQSNLYDSMKFDIIKTFDLSNGYFKSIIDSITTNAMYTDENIQYNNSALVANGINIANGLMSNAKYDISKMQFDEYSITEANNVITNIFKNNNLIVSNIINFEFEFELDVAGLYDIVGFYTNDINNIDITANTSAASIYNDNKILIDNSMTAVKSYNDETKVYDLHKFDVTKDYESTYYRLLRKVVSPNASLITKNLNSFFVAKILKSIAIGDSIAITENDTVYRIYCDSVRNDSVFFKYSDNISEQVENIKDCIARLNTSSVYSIKFTADGVFTIEAINTNDYTYAIDIPDAWSAITYKDKLVEQQTINTTYTFVAAINVKNTIAIHNVSSALSGIVYTDIRHCTVKINGEDKNLTFKSLYVDTLTNSMYISFNENIEFDDNIRQTILLTLYAIEHLQVCQMQFYDICAFDIDFANANIKNKHNTLNNIQLFKQYNETYSAQYDEMLQQYATIDDNPCISNITQSTIQYSTNDFDRLKEYDVAAYATFNRINQGINKWSSVNGFNAYRKPMLMNMSIVYGQANLSPAFDNKDFHNTHSLAFDYFIMGVAADSIDDTAYYEHTAETITSLNDLEEPNALQRFFEHSISNQINDYTYEDVIKLYSTIDKQDDVAKTIFNGVEYVFNKAYAGWSFAIVHANITNSAKFKLIVNNKAKAIFVVICKQIDNNIITTNFSTGKLIVKRFMYYMNFSDSINGTLNDRFYDISFYEFCKYLTSSNSDIHYTVPSNILLNVSLESKQTALSHDITTSDVTVYAIQKYALKLRPTVYTIVKAYNFMQQSNVILIAQYDNIKDYCIFKVGNSTTLTTDDINSTTTPSHFLIGETVYDFIDLNPIQQTKLHRFYTQKSNYILESSNLLYSMNNCFSVLPVLNITDITITAVNTDTVTINVLDILKQRLSSLYPHAINTEQYAKLLLSLLNVTLDCKVKSTNEAAILINSTTALNKLSDNVLQFNDKSTYLCILNFSTK